MVLDLSQGTILKKSVPIILNSKHKESGPQAPHLKHNGSEGHHLFQHRATGIQGLQPHKFKRLHTRDRWCLFDMCEGRDSEILCPSWTVSWTLILMSVSGATALCKVILIGDGYVGQ